MAPSCEASAALPELVMLLLVLSADTLVPAECDTEAALALALVTAPTPAGTAGPSMAEP